jgi:hypothetical protein
MILPGKITGMKGVIGTTFDAIFLVYPSEYDRFQWPLQASEANWKEGQEYHPEMVRIGSDGKAYVAITASIGINPVIDKSGHWEKLIPFNLTGCSAEAKFDGEKIVLKTGSGIVMGGSEGTISVRATPTQTVTLTPQKLNFGILVTETSGNLYEYVKAVIEWEEQ